MVKQSNKFINFLLEGVQVLMVFLGVAAALTCTATSLELTYDRTMFLSFMFVGAVLFYALFSVLETIRFGKLFGIGGLLVFYGALAIRFYEELVKGFITIVNSFLKQFMNITGSNLGLLSYKDKDDVSVGFSTTLVLIILGVLLIAIVSAFFYRRRRSSVFLIMTLPFVIIPMYVGRVGNYIDMIVYLVILMAVIGTRQQKTASTDRQIRQKLSVLLVGVGIIAGLLSIIIVTPGRYERNKNTLLETKNTLMSLATWDSEDIFTWIRANFNDSAIDYGKIGKKAEVNHTGQTLIKISGDVNPNYGLYLKSFVANVYENNKWTSNKKNAEFKQDLAALATQNITPDSYHVQLRNDVGDNEKSGFDDLWAIGNLHVKNLAFGFGNYLIPVLPESAYITENDGMLTTRVPGIEYDEEYFLNYPYSIRRMLMTPSEDLTDPVFWTTYKDKTDALKAFAEKYYLQVPEDLTSVCARFKDEYKTLIQKFNDGEGDISELLKAVRDYIAKDTTYTESPGRTPSGRDTVEYFLNESKKGYCTYYATAAAILLRSVGIPTRYVEGLYITPEELKEGIPGEISIPDYDAHAWIEVYDERYGFVTFETTPGEGEQLGAESQGSGYSDGSGNGNGDGTGDADTEPTPQVTEVPEENMEFEDIEGNEESMEEEETGKDGGQLGSDKEKEDSGALKVILIILLIIVVIAAAMEGQRRIRRHLFRKNLSDMKNKRRRIRLTHRHITPYLMKKGVRYDGQSMDELIAELCDALGVHEDVIRCYIELVFRAAFGPDDLTEQDMFRFREAYEDICRHAYRDAGPLSKVYYMYFLCL